MKHLVLIRFVFFFSWFESDPPKACCISVSFLLCKWSLLSALSVCKWTYLAWLSGCFCCGSFVHCCDVMLGVSRNTLSGTQARWVQLHTQTGKQCFGFFKLWSLTQQHHIGSAPGFSSPTIVFMERLVKAHQPTQGVPFMPQYSTWAQSYRPDWCA